MIHLSENSYITSRQGRTCRACHGSRWWRDRLAKGRYLSITPVRGLEKDGLLKPPESAIVLCQRICGVCPIPHTLASQKQFDSLI